MSFATLLLPFNTIFYWIMEKKYNENGSNAAGGVCNMVLPTLMYFNPYKKKFASKY